MERTQCGIGEITFHSYPTRDEPRCVPVHRRTPAHLLHRGRLLDTLGCEPEESEDPTVEGTIEAHEEFVDKEPSEGALDRFNIAAGQKSEHYEIACYGNRTPMADQLGLDEAADTLERNICEEQDALDDLARLGEEFDDDRIEA